MSGSTNVVFSPGQVYRRRDLHETFGGQRQGGISTPAKAPFIFLITGDSGNGTATPTNGRMTESSSTRAKASVGI
jgi:hypothetical protein